MRPLAVADRLVWRLASECRNDDVLIVGVATPIAAAAGLLARELLVPDLTVLVAASVQPPVHDIARPMLEADFVARHAVGSFGQADVLDLLHRGGVTLQFVSPAQVDRRGRLNSGEVRRPDGSALRLPGPLALPDVACMVGRLVGYRAAHSRRVLVDEVDFVTGLGSADLRTRAAARLPGRGLLALITELAVLRFEPASASVRLESLAPGVDVAEVRAGCGFPLDVPRDPVVEQPPPAEALDLLDRVIDPHGVRGMEVPATRAAAQARLAALT
jgi:glutaconate CoA-transferase subunit B